MTNASGAVFDDTLGVDSAVPWHYGDPHSEQRALIAGVDPVAVDLSHRGVITVSGNDSILWLNDLVTQQIVDAPGNSWLALILDPHGHVQFELRITYPGDRLWITTDPGATERLVSYLDSMRFMRDVAVHDVSTEYASVWVTNPLLSPVATWTPPPEFRNDGFTDSGMDVGGGAGKYVPRRPGQLPGQEIIVPRESVAGVMAKAVPVGTWAFEAIRVAAGIPRLGFDSDPKSLPHELGYIGPGVHLAKGCYRGQETVARVHNLGRPPRRLVLLHLDGSTSDLPEHGDSISAGGRQIGSIGSVARHYELGPIATATIKNSVDSSLPVLVSTTAGPVAASIEDIVVTTAPTRRGPR